MKEKVRHKKQKHELVAKQVKTKTKKRFDYIDLLKALAIFFVVLIHNFRSPVDFIASPDFATYINYIIRLLIEGVPIFVAINGFLLINKKFELKKHLKKCLKIFLIILAWSLILTIVLAFISGDHLTIQDTIYNVLTTKSGGKYTGMLWFLQSLLVLYLFFPILKNVHDTNKKLYNYFFILVLIFTVGLNLIDSCFNIINVIKQTEYTAWLDTLFHVYNPIANGYFLLFFMLGGYIYEYKDKLLKYRKKVIIAALVSFVIAILYGILVSKMRNEFYSSNFLYSSICLLPIIVGIFTLSFKFKNNNLFTKFICIIGQNSMGIYLLHYFLTVIFLSWITSNSLLATFGAAIIVLLVSLITTLIIKKIPGLRKLVSL